MSLRASLFFYDHPLIYQYAEVVVSATGAVISLVAILVLDFVSDILHWLQFVCHDCDLVFYNASTYGRAALSNAANCLSGPCSQFKNGGFYGCGYYRMLRGIPMLEMKPTGHDGDTATGDGDQN